MPTWLLGIGAVIIMLIRRPLISWLLGFVKREASSVLRSYDEERLQSDAAAARAVQQQHGAAQGSDRPATPSK